LLLLLLQLQLQLQQCCLLLQWYAGLPLLLNLLLHVII
jgi:hypothetical protein